MNSLKNLEKRNQIQLYIKEGFKPYWVEFLKIIDKDKKLRDLQDPKYKGKHLSLAVSLLVRQYVLENADEDSPVIQALKEAKERAEQ